MMLMTLLGTILVVVIIFVVVVFIVWLLMKRQSDLSRAEQIEQHYHDSPEQATEGVPQQGLGHMPTTEAVEDDLALIEGIGPRINSVFKAAGIRTFKDLSLKTPEELRVILHEAGLRLGDPTSWPEQARLAAEGKLDELKELQDNLKAGRIEG